MQDAIGDKELVERAQQGDEHALKLLLDRYQPQVRRRALAMLPNCLRDGVNDVVQDTLIAACRNLTAFKYGREGCVAAWLTKIATRKALDYARAENKRKPREVDQDQRVDDHIANSFVVGLMGDEAIGSLHEVVAKVFSTLPYDCRILLLAQMAYEISPLDVARVSGSLFEEVAESRDRSSGIRKWFLGIIGDLEAQMKYRHQYCRKKFLIKLRVLDHAQKRDKVSQED